MITDDQLQAIVRGETGSQSSTELIRAIADELLRLRHRVLAPLTEAEVVAALHEGHAERRVAQGDNAWTSIVASRDRLRDALREACDIADAALMPNESVSREWYEHTMNGDLVRRVRELREIAGGTR